MTATSSPPGVTGSAPPGLEDTRPSTAAPAVAGRATGSPAAAAVVVDGAGKCFGDVWPVSDLTFSVDYGEVLGLIGPSGSGKTTTVRMLNGALRPSAGEIRILGEAPHRLSTGQRQRLGYLPQQPVLFDQLSAWENLQFHAGLNGVRLRRAARLRELLEFVELADDEKRPVSQMSGGMKRRLALAATLIHRPELIFLDEPTAGIDPILRARMWERFHELADGGTTLVVTTQYIGEAAHCDRVGLLADGGLIALDEPERLRERAAGGALTAVETDRPLSDRHLEALVDVPGVLAVERIDDATIRVVTEPGDEAALDATTEFLTGHAFEVRDSRPTVLEYDDMFVRLVEDHLGQDRPDTVTAANDTPEEPR